MRNPCCWVLSDGKAGMENQCLGLAEAIGLPTTIKRLKPGFPWAYLPPQANFAPLRGLAAGSDPLTPPWPNLLIATGRQSVAPAIAVRRASNGGCFLVQIQNPRVAPAAFDLIVAPQHDNLQGDNVVSTVGALHRVTPARLAADAARFADRAAGLPTPRLAVLIGGSNRAYRYDTAAMENLAGLLRQAASAQGLGLLVTYSRRTAEPLKQAFAQALGDTPAVIWDQTGDNPYYGWLGLAAAIVVTADSVSMVSEALSTAKPVHVFEMPGANRKFADFHARLRGDKLTRPFAGRMERWTYVPPNDTAKVAAIVRTKMGLQDAATVGKTL